LDANNAAFRLPDLIFKLLVTGALSASFIPVFSSHLNRNRQEAYRFASAVINLLLLTLILLSFLVFVFARPLSSLIAAGFSFDQISLMASLTRILLVSQIFFLVSNFITGILHVNQIFIVPSLSPIIYNLFIILAVFTLAPTFGVYGLTFGALIGAFFHFAIQLPALKRLKFHYSLFFSTRLVGVREVIRLMIPRTLSLGLGEIENTITLFFASGLASGSISLLNLAFQVMYLPSRIFGTTIGQASLPILSKNIAKNELEKFRITVNRTVIKSLFIALPVATFILVYRLPLVRLIFGARQFPWSATLITARTLAFLTPAIFCQAIIQILVRSFYALHNTKTPLYVSLASLVANVSFSYFFITYTSLGIIGLAISASIGNLIQGLGLSLLFIHKVDGGEWLKTVRKFIYLILACFIMASVSYLSLRFLDLFVFDTSRTVNLIYLCLLSFSLGLAAYLLTTTRLCPDEFQDYRRYFLKLKHLFSSS
jgi:putative peptidoglycan lipid II flippase